MSKHLFDIFDMVCSLISIIKTHFVDFGGPAYLIIVIAARFHVPIYVLMDS